MNRCISFLLLLLVFGLVRAQAPSCETFTNSYSSSSHISADINNSDGVNVAVVGVPSQVSGNGMVDFWHYNNTYQTWMRTFTVYGKSQSNLGYAVSISYDMAALGAPGAGEVHVYTLSNGMWNLTQVLSSPSGDTSSGFGMSVALAGDGTLVVGAPESEEVHVYAYKDGTYTGYTTASESQSAGYGFAVAISNSGEYMAVGAPGLLTTSGSAYYYNVINSTAELVYSATSTSPSSTDLFGASVGVWGGLGNNGEGMVVGAPGNGLVFVYDSPGNGTTQAISSPMKDIVWGTSVAVDNVYGGGEVLMAVGAPATLGSQQGYAFSLVEVDGEMQVATKLSNVQHLFGKAIAVSNGTALVSGPNSATFWCTDAM